MVLKHAGRLCVLQLSKCSKVNPAEFCEIYSHVSVQRGATVITPCFYIVLETLNREREGL